MTSCAGTFSVTVRRLTRTMRSTAGISSTRPGPALVGDAPEAEHDAALVLAQHAHRRRGQRRAGRQQAQEADDEQRHGHALSSHSSARRTLSVSPRTASTTTTSPSCSGAVAEPAVVAGAPQRAVDVHVTGGRVPGAHDAVVAAQRLGARADAPALRLGRGAHRQQRPGAGREGERDGDGHGDERAAAQRGDEHDDAGHQRDGPGHAEDAAGDVGLGDHQRGAPHEEGDAECGHGRCLPVDATPTRAPGPGSGQAIWRASSAASTVSRASTTSGSNCVPAPSRSSASAAARPSAVR